MDRESKLKIINEKLANKDLDLGCRVRYEDREWRYFRATDPNWIKSHILLDANDDIGSSYYTAITDKTFQQKEEFEIIGSPVMINDVILYMVRNSEQYVGDYSFEITLANLVKRWLNIRKPIERQTDLCVDTVYEILSKNNLSLLRDFK